jgi:hypothetical protein
VRSIKEVVELALAVESGSAREADQRELAAAVLELFGRDASDTSTTFVVRVTPEIAATVAPIFVNMARALTRVAELDAVVPGEPAGSG